MKASEKKGTDRAWLSAEVKSKQVYLAYLSIILLSNERQYENHNMLAGLDVQTIQQIIFLICFTFYRIYRHVIHVIWLTGSASLSAFNRRHGDRLRC